MVGFPGEDDNAFRNSMNFINDFEFVKVYVLPYSPSEVTYAS